jgi:hypothetical protein
VGKNIRNNLIGDKSFYKNVIAIVLPIIIQNTITNVVSLVDNVMVGRVGMLEMSSVAIVNQLLLVFNLCIFGGLAGAGIFTAQFAGAKDDNGVTYIFDGGNIGGNMGTVTADNGKTYSYKITAFNTNNTANVTLIDNETQQEYSVLLDYRNSQSITLTFME